MPPRLALILLASLALSACPAVDDDDATNAGDCSDLAATVNPPVMNLTAPADSTIYALTDDIPVIGTVSDEGTEPGDLDLDLFDVIDIEPERVDVELPDIDGSGGFSFSIPAGTLVGERHVLRMVVIDPDGCTDSEEAFVCIDTTDCLGS